MNSPSDFLQWLASASLYAGLLAAIILAIKACAGRLISPWWHYGLWFLVLARLVIPAGPQSPLSLANYIGPVQSVSGEPAAPQKALRGILTTRSSDTPAPAPEINTANSPPGMRLPTPLLSLSNLLLALWALGAGTVLVTLFRNSRRLSRTISHATPAAHSALPLIITQCLETARITRPVRFLQSNAVSNPVLAGLFRPVVLLPPATLASATPGELRFIILHELTHLRRGDLIVNTAVALLQAVHWFNPVLWIAFARMRADRELACDAAVIRLLGREQAHAYGSTILKLAEAASAARPLAGSIGIIEVKSDTGKRILMISRNSNPSHLRAVCGFVIAAVIGVTGFTTAQSASPLPATEFQNPPTSNTSGSLGLLSGADPFKLSVAPDNGELKYTFDPQRELESISALRGVTFSTAETTITCDRLDFTSATQELTAHGPDLKAIIDRGQSKLHVTAENLVYTLTDDTIEFRGGVTVNAHIGNSGVIQTTTGENVRIGPIKGSSPLRVRVPDGKINLAQ